MFEVKKTSVKALLILFVPLGVAALFVHAENQIVDDMTIERVSNMETPNPAVPSVMDLYQISTSGDADGQALEDRYIAHLFSPSPPVVKVKNKPAKPKVKTPSPPQPVVSKKSDYREDVSRRVDLQAISKKGAFINGDYYRVGSTLSRLEYYNDSKFSTEHPVFRAIDNCSVVLDVSGYMLTIKGRSNCKKEEK